MSCEVNERVQLTREDEMLERKSWSKPRSSFIPLLFVQVVFAVQFTWLNLACAFLFERLGEGRGWSLSPSPPSCIFKSIQIYKISQISTIAFLSEIICQSWRHKNPNWRNYFKMSAILCPPSWISNLFQVIQNVLKNYHTIRENIEIYKIHKEFGIKFSENLNMNWHRNWS